MNEERKLRSALDRAADRRESDFRELELRFKGLQVSFVVGLLGMPLSRMIAATHDDFYFITMVFVWLSIFDLVPSFPFPVIV